MKKVYCESCAKQCVDRNVSRYDKNLTTLKNSKMGINSVFCGYCAEELDENGLFPEERLWLGLSDTAIL